MSGSPSIFRIDKFVVPQGAREAFVAKLSETHAFLDAADGCLQNHILEQVSGPGEFNIVTVVEWRDAAAFEAARAAALARHAAAGFDPKAMQDALGVRADLANYAAVER